MQDDDRLRDERKKAKANRDKYIGVGSDSSTHRYSKFYLYLCDSVISFMSFFPLVDRWNDYDDSNGGNGSSSTGKKKDFVELDGRWRSTNPSILEESFNKAEDLAQKVKDLVIEQRNPSQEYSPEIR